MKRLILMLTICFSMISMTSIASEPEISKAALKSFTENFKDATDVKWSTAENFYRVSFFLNGQYISAFYDKDGNNIALTKNISSQQLPLVLQTSMKKNYENYWITDLFEVNDEKGINYYVSLENSTSKVILKAGMDAEWTVFSKMSK